MNNKQSIAINPMAIQNDISIIRNDIADLKNYLRTHTNELYATPQLLDAEVPKTIIVLRTVTKHKESLITMINPQILERMDKIAVEETQSQVEGTYLNIRHPKITVAYISLPAVTPINITLTGKAAIMFQQAYSLLQGIPISLLGLRIDDYKEYQEATEEERQEIIAHYIQDLKDIFEESKKDKETNDYLKASEFMSEKIQRSVIEEISAANEIKETHEGEADEKLQSSGADKGANNERAKVLPFQKPGKGV